MLRSGPALLLFAVAAAQAGAQDPDPVAVREALAKLAPGESVKLGPVTFTIHQRRETPDATGAYPARSKAGGFAVTMPVPFVDMTGVAPGTDGVSIATHTIAGRSTEGAKFTAMCFQRADGAEVPGWAEKSAESMRKGAESFVRRAVEQGAAKGVEVAATGHGARYLARYLATKGSGCLVAAEYPIGQAEGLQPVARAFVDSFQPPL